MSTDSEARKNYFPQAQQPAARRHLPKALKILIAVISGLSIVWFAGMKIWDIRATARLEKMLADVKPTTLAQIKEEYEKGLQGENAAPYWRAAAKLASEEPLASAIDTAYGTLPTLGEPLKSNDSIKSDPALPNILPLVEKAALIPSCTYGSKIILDNPAASELPGNLHDLFQLSKTLAFVSITSDSSRAAALITANLFKLAGSLKREPSLICELVRVACDQMALDAIEWVMAQRALSSEELEVIDGALAEEIDCGRLRRAYIWERAEALQSYIILMAKGNGGWIKDGAVVQLSWMTDVVKACEKKPRECRKAIRAIHLQVDQCCQEAKRLSWWPGNWKYTLPCLLMPNIQGAAEKIFSTQTALESARVALAVERFRGEKGRLPEKLDELAPAYIKEIPKDVFDEKDGVLKYKKLDKGYIIYSVGLDGADNGGKFDPKKPRGGKASDSEGFDIVFRVLR